ncbi:right-handed parallel beta-helix repeat-containing protein [Actinosynnema sp. NPDC023658]|uniref:right-handed parallel beta-helix repeat-containing protein n=1 Tax=Actinosynnema sp. NPDC023658 TaxID=3155465 RepID=UPI0033CEDDF2
MITVAAVAAGMLVGGAASQADPTASPTWSATATCSGVNVPLGADIQGAVNANPAGTTYCLAAGTYRLSAPLALKTGDTLWGAGPSPTSGTVLSGARVLTGWVASGANWYVSGVLPPSYQDANGQCENLSTNLCHKFEDVFRNSTQLLRVASLDQLGPGGFYPDYAANRVYVRDDPAGVTTQIGRTPAANTVGGATDVVIRDLGVRYFASPSQAGALELGHRWKVFSVATSYNHALGFKVTGNGASFTAGRSSYNGQLGGGVNRGRDFTISDVEVDHNNAQALYWVSDWESGGIKVTNGATGVVERANVHDNFGIGLWADGQAGDPAVADSLRFVDSSVVHNSADGVRFEISSNGRISDNTVTDNGCDLLGRRGPQAIAGLPDGAGIDVNTSVGVVVSGNVVSRNHNGIGGQERRNRELHLQHLRVVDNTVDLTRCANDFGLGLAGVVTDQRADRPPYWGGTFTAEGDNLFVGNDYRIPAVDGGLSAKRFAWNGSYRLTWATWTGYGQDAGGTAVAIP